MMRTLRLFLLLLVLVSCKKESKNLNKITAKNLVVTTTITPSEKIDSVIAPYKKKLTAEMQEVLTYAPKDFLKNNEGMQTSIGNLMADLCYRMANPIYKKKTNESIDFVMLNNGGIRATIPQGKVTVERAFKLMPFENELVAVTLTGEKITELVDYFIKNKTAHPFCRNVNLTLNDNDYLLKIRGKDFDKNKSYTVLTSDFLQSGGDKMTFFKNPEKLTKLDCKMRDVIIDYFKKVDTLQASIDNRVIIE